MSVPAKHHPTPEERDERVSVDLDPEEFIEGVLAVEPDENGEPVGNGESAAESD